MFSFFHTIYCCQVIMTISVIQLKMYISRNVRVQFRILTLFTNSRRTNRFLIDECIQNSWTKLCLLRCVAERRCHTRKNDELRPLCNIFWPVGKICIFRGMVCLCIDGHNCMQNSSHLHQCIHREYTLHVLDTCSDRS